ncbi:MAG: class I SAM-dependent methyltransferase [Eubacteriaceae bacterium]|nr:class I SAM-dependent methyltransferase [Eubacteriaceae bacterium]
MTEAKTETKGDLVIVAAEGVDMDAAERLADHLGTEVVREGDLADAGPAPRGEAVRSEADVTNEDDAPRGNTVRRGGYVPCEALVLRMDENGLALEAGGQQLRGDFSKMLRRTKQGSLQRELVVRAARIKDAEGALTAVDATAGLGEDSFLLAAAGFSVRLFEYNPVIAALLGDALRRAAETPELADIAGRMELVEGDSRAEMPLLPYHPDVILLDPMFPARHKSALVKKKLQLLQQLEQPCTDEADLVRAAMAAGPWKVIIKRPLKGDFLGGIRPSYSISGKMIRYDCLAVNSTP